MTKPLTPYDTSVLRSAGFKAGFSGESHWGVDYEGQLWHAYPEGEYLYFDKRDANEGRRTMKREEFTQLFERRTL